MVGKYQMTAVRNEEASFNRDRHRSLDRLGLFNQRERIQNNTAADHAFHVRMKNSRRNQMQNVVSIADIDGMPCVVATLIARDAVVAFGQDIDNLTLAFVPPLEPYDCEILFHYRCLSRALVMTPLSTAPTICS